MGSRYDEHDNGDTTGTFLLGFLAGAAAGAIAAVLYAPKSGAETRTKIKDLADRQKENLSNQWEQTKGKATEAVNAAREKIDAATGQTKSIVDGIASKVQASAGEADQELNASVDKFQRRM